MSRSYRKNRIFANAASGHSEKDDKRAANQALRTGVRQALRDPETASDGVLPDLRSVSNAAAMSKDGRHWWAKATKKDMAK